MVVKRGISSKVFLLFFSLILAAFGLVLIVIINILSDITENETYFRLNAYSSITAFAWENGEEIKTSSDENYNFWIIQGKINIEDKNVLITNYNDPFNIVSSEEILDEVINNAFNLQSDIGEFVLSQGDIYYYKIALSRQIDEFDYHNFVVFLINDDYTNMFKQRMIAYVALIFSLVLILISVIVSVWINKLIKRIKKLQEHVNHIKSSDYSEEYIDEGNDEITELSLSIEEMRVDIKNSELTKQEMLQNVSHDFKTPIAVIKNYAEAIQDGVLNLEAAETILKQADILKEKVNQLLQYNKLEYLSKDKSFEQINMKEICQEVASPYTFNGKVDIVLNLEDCYFDGYRDNFITVIGNILDNALRYAKSKIIITTKKNKVTIYNDGPHIEDAFLNGNFKAYEKGAKGQFGLGMSIVKKTLDFFNLKLNVYNEENGGVSFVIYK